MRHFLFIDKLPIRFYLVTHPVKFEMMYPIRFTNDDYNYFNNEFRSRFANGFQKTQWQSDFNIYVDMGTEYAVRMQALFSPDVTGTYSFWLRADDWAILFIGTDEKPSSRQKIAELTYAESAYTM